MSNTTGTWVRISLTYFFSSSVHSSVLSTRDCVGAYGILVPILTQSGLKHVNISQYRYNMHRSLLFFGLPISKRRSRVLVYTMLQRFPDDSIFFVAS